MQVFEDILIMLKTGRKTEAIETYAAKMNINEIEARIAIENLIRETNIKLAIKGKQNDEYTGSRYRGRR